MGMSRSRNIALSVALATLSSNVLSTILFSQLPDDPYHLASNFGWYLHFASVLSVFGFVGALREHALSIAIFSNYLILDTLLCAVPRFLILSLLQPLSSTLCSAPNPYLQALTPTTPSSTLANDQNQLATFSPSASAELAAPPATQWDSLTAGWSPEGCVRFVTLLQMTLFASLVAATVLQFVGALCVRGYAKRLLMREARSEERMGRRGVEQSDCLDDEDRVVVVLVEDGKLPTIEEIDEFVAGSNEKC